MPTPLSSTAKVIVRRFGARADRDRAAAIGEADRVRQQIEQDLVERALVGDHLRQIVGASLSELNAGLARPQRQQAAAAGDDLRRRERLRRDLEIVGLDLRHVEYAVDDRQEMMSGIVDEAGIFVAALGVEHQRVFLHQHFGKADDGIERRAQFVTHGGEEAALGGVGALGLGMRVEKRLLLPFALGHVAQYRDDLAAIFAAIRPLVCSNGRQRISIQTNSVVGRPSASTASRRTRNSTERDFTESGGVAQRGQIGRTVGDMDPVEQAVAVQVARCANRTRLRRPARRTARRRRGRAA